jgi:hypothetical protein
LDAGMAQKSAEFRRQGAEIYIAVERVDKSPS